MERWHRYQLCCTFPKSGKKFQLNTTQRADGWNRVCLPVEADAVCLGLACVWVTPTANKPSGRRGIRRPASRRTTHALGPRVPPASSGVLAGCLCRRPWHAGQGPGLRCVRRFSDGSASADAVDPIRAHPSRLVSRVAYSLHLTGKRYGGRLD